mmetsp:Transcript_1983/g.4546  ORF Transcript_1983/g.4546 Transcript_1983/m.4546 type:complete len:160 (-) Transcript_1983:1494-1973(-)
MMIPLPSQGNPSPLSLSENNENILTTIFTRREKQNSPICFSDDENRILSEILPPPSSLPGTIHYPPSSVRRYYQPRIPMIRSTLQHWILYRPSRSRPSHHWRSYRFLHHHGLSLSPTMKDNHHWTPLSSLGIMSSSVSSLYNPVIADILPRDGYTSLAI